MSSLSILKTKNCGKWPLGVAEELFEGCNGKVLAAKLRVGKIFLERPIQRLYPLELACDKVPGGRKEGISDSVGSSLIPHHNKKYGSH